MKYLTLFLLALSSTAAFANPFQYFVGDYQLVGTPQVAMSAGMKYCDWQGFREMSEVSISPKNGTYESDLFSNNGHLQSYTDFQEYAYTGDFGVTNTAKITGDATGANYEVVDASPGSMTATTWTISKSGSNYHLRQTWQSNSNSSTVNSCVYDADLLRK